MNYGILAATVAIFATQLSMAEAGNKEGNGTGGLVGGVSIPYQTNCSTEDAANGACKTDVLAPWRTAFNQMAPLKLAGLPKKTFCLENSLGFHVDSGASVPYPIVCFALDQAVPMVGHYTDRNKLYPMSDHDESLLPDALRKAPLNALQQENGEWVSYWDDTNNNTGFYSTGYSLPYDSDRAVYGTFRMTFHQSGTSILVRVELCPLPDSDSFTNGYHAPVTNESGYYERAYIFLDTNKDRVK